MLPSDIRSLTEAYQSIYAPKEETVEITEELLDEALDELVDEFIEEGYEEEEALSILEEATDAYLEEAKVTFGSDTTPMRASGARVGARRRYGRRKAGEALKAAGEKAKSAVDSAKGAYKTAKAGVQIAGSIAKDEARRAGRKAAHAVTSAPGKAKAAVDRKKKETKRGIKGFIKRQAEKVVQRMSEGVNQVYELEGEMVDEARRADKEGYARGSKENPKRKDVSHGDPSQRTMLHSKLKRRADEMGRERRSSARNKAGGRTPVSKKEKAFLQAADRTRQQVRNPNVPDTGKHKVKEGFEALQASGLFSEQELAKIAEQMTTQTQIPPAGDTWRRGTTKPPAAPQLPPPPSATKKKPEPKLGAGVPGFQYGRATGP